MGMGRLGNQITASLLPEPGTGHAAKSGIISVKSSLCSRGPVSAPAHAVSPIHRDVRTSLEGPGQTAQRQQMDNTDHTNQTTEILHPAITQVNLHVHIG